MLPMSWYLVTIATNSHQTVTETKPSKAFSVYSYWKRHVLIKDPLEKEMKKNFMPPPSKVQAG